MRLDRGKYLTVWRKQVDDTCCVPSIPFGCCWALSPGGWAGQQRDAIDYLREKNRVLREQLGGKRLRLSDDERRRLAATVRPFGL